MPTIKYGDVVEAKDTLEGADLEEKLRKRRLAASKEKLQNSEEVTEVQQADNNTENESK